MPAKRNPASQPTLGDRKPRRRPPGAKGKVIKPPSWRDFLKLNPGEELRQTQSTSVGNLLQDDLESYDVIDSQGTKAGSVVYSASTSLKPPFRTANQVEQRNMVGDVIVRESWQSN